MPAADSLPAQVTSFVGREQEIAEVEALLTQNRLVTLTGPGGTGKTRLALEVARITQDDYGDGVRFVGLSTVHETSLVPKSIAEVLGVVESSSRSLIELLMNYLNSKQMLLLIDNFEQVIDAAPIISDLLEAAADLKILVTSREVLQVYGEQEYPVPPLAVPDALTSLSSLTNFEAIALFVQRARYVKPDFELDLESGPTIAEICRRVDGLPLAIELAAARIKLLTPKALLERLDHRLNVLTSANRDLPERQQTLRQTIDWSYQLLDDTEKRLFACLGVFQGGVNLDALEEICEFGPPDDILDTTNEPRSTLKEMSFRTTISPRKPTAGKTFLRTATERGWVSGAICWPLP